MSDVKKKKEGNDDISPHEQLFRDFIENAEKRNKERLERSKATRKYLEFLRPGSTKHMLDYEL